MKRLQSRLFFAAVIGYFVFFLFHSLFTMNDNKLPFYILSLVLLVLHVHATAFILRRYERGIAWARIAAFVLVYATLVLFARDAVNLVLALARGRGAGSLLALLFDFIVIGMVVASVVLLHTEKHDTRAAVSKPDEKPAVPPGPDTTPTAS